MVAILSAKAKTIKKLIETDGLEDIIKELRNVELADDILQCFSTGEMINALDKRCELGEAHTAYMRNIRGDLETAIVKELNKDAKVKLLAAILGIPYLSTCDEYAEAIKTYIG